jgi:hypothetical protein
MDDSPSSTSTMIAHTQEHLRTVREFLRTNRTEVLSRADDHLIWAGDFNRHHPMWDDESDDRLFTPRALEDAGKLIELLADLNLKMALPKGQPTLEHMVTKKYSRPDNFWCTEEIFDLIIRCEVDPSLRPPGTDHFPIATYIDLPQERSTQSVLQLQGSGLGRLSRKPRHSSPRNTTSSATTTDQQFQRQQKPNSSNPRHDPHQSPRKQTVPVLQEMVEQRPQSAENCDKKAKSARVQVQGLARSRITHRATQGQEYVRRGHSRGKENTGRNSLENAAEQDLWTANRYFKEPTGDGGKSRIPTLKVPEEGRTVFYAGNQHKRR